MWLIFVMGAALLYWPALGVGYLSDDWDLQSLARDWKIGPVMTTLIRPVPLFFWAVLQNLGAGSAVAHGMNIVIHGTNAYLVQRLCARWLAPGLPALLAGTYFLTSPLAVEPVVWCSGLFDLAATAALLALVLQSRDYASASTLRRACFLGTAALAIACKETAVVGVALVLVDVWMVRAPRGRLFGDVLGIFLGCVIYTGFRLVFAPDRGQFQFTRNVLRRSLFETFGGLSAPWHADAVAGLPWLPFLGPMGSSWSMVGRFARRSSTGRTQQVCAIVSCSPFARTLRSVCVRH